MDESDMNKAKIGMVILIVGLITALYLKKFWLPLKYLGFFAVAGGLGYIGFIIATKGNIGGTMFGAKVKKSSEYEAFRAKYADLSEEDAMKAYLKEKQLMNLELEMKQHELKLKTLENTGKMQDVRIKQEIAKAESIKGSGMGMGGGKLFDLNALGEIATGNPQGQVRQQPQQRQQQPRQKQQRVQQIFVAPQGYYEYNTPRQRQQQPSGYRPIQDDVQRQMRPIQDTIRKEKVVDMHELNDYLVNGKKGKKSKQWDGNAF